MELTKLKIKKFRGLNNLELNFQSGINILTGNNGIGKTTILDCILWLLADETIIYGKTNEDNLDKNNPKDVVEVEGTFTKDDGSELVLKRVFYGKYKEDVYIDNINELYINNAKYSVKEYNARIYQEIGLNADLITKGFNDVRCLMDFDYLGTIDYKKAREKLETLLNITSDDTLINQEKYEPIKNDLIALMYDTVKAKTMLNSELKKNESLLEQANAVKHELESQNKDIKDLDSQKADLQKMLESYENQEFEYSKEYKQAKEKINQAFKEKEEVNNKLDEAEKKMLILTNQVNNLNETIKSDKAEFVSLKEQYAGIKNSLVTCPKCHYQLNGEDIKERLDEINVKGAKIKKHLEEISQNESFEKYKKATEIISKIKAISETANKTYDKVLAETKVLIEKQDQECEQFYIIKNQNVAETKARIKVLEETNIAPKRIEEVEKEIAKISEAKAKVELKLQLLDDYRKDKIKIVEEKTQQVFPNIDFVLIEISKTGAITQTCKATYKGVDYLGLNDGQKIKLGIELIEDLRKAFGVTEILPILVNKLSDLSNANKKALKELTSAQIFCTHPADENKIEVKNI